MSIKTIIVDDEYHAREGIKARLADHPSIELIGECSSGIEAVEMTASLKPDLLFLDIQMPELNGFEVLNRLSAESLPIIIFVTAFDRYAVKAFEVHALDYLLKPIDDVRFDKMIQAAVTEFKHRNLEKYAATLRSFVNDYFDVLNDGLQLPAPQQTAGMKKFPDRFMVKVKGVMSFIPVNDIEWIESAGDYVYLHANAKKFIIRETMIHIEQKLDPLKFIRIHRSTIVNTERIKSIHPNAHGDFDVFLHSDAKLKLSRKYRGTLNAAFGE